MPKLSSLFIFSIIFSSCGGVTTDEARQYGNPSVEILKTRSQGEMVNFNQLQIGLIEPDCIGCHSKWSEEAELMKWVTPGDPEKSILYLSVASGRMPKSRSQLEKWKIDLLRDFISQKQPPEEAPLPLEPTYRSLEYHLFKASCTGCHGGNGVTEGGFDFTKYEYIVSALLDIEDSAILDSRMPKDPLPKLTQPVKDAFRAWVNKGAPND